VSAPRWFSRALLAALLAAAAALPARAQIVARVGGNLAGRIGDTLDVPVTVDLRAAAGVRLGSYRMTLRYNEGVLAEMQVGNGSFAPPLVNTDSAYQGANSVLRLTAVQPSGADSVVTLFVVRFMVVSDTGQSDITIAFDEMSAAGTFADLLPSLSVVNGTFCHATGRWGDVDADGQSNSRDALIALSKVVGLALDTMVIVPIDSVHSDTIVTMRPSLADVDGDGQVTSRDALVIVSYAVGLPVPGFRIGLAAAGACGSGLGITLAAWPDTLDLETGQSANIVVSAQDGAGQPVSLTGATWTSSNTAVAGALSGFAVEARGAGLAVLTARLGSSYATSMVVRVVAHRSQWYVDAVRVQAPIRTGSAAFPFAYIQDAFDAGRDGDTVNVASGTYEEAVGSDISVLLRGDPANPPVIDARGAASYSPNTPALSVGSRAAPMVIDHLAVSHGHVAIYAHDFAARSLHIEGDTIAVPLYFSSVLSLGSSDTGNVTLDSVTVHGYGTAYHGIEIPLADSVIIRNSAVTRDTAGSTFCGSYLGGPGGIMVQWAAHTEIRNTAVTNSPCMGITVQQPAGSATFSGNRVVGLAGAGIAVNAPTIAFDHNLVRDARVPGSYGAGTVGIWVVAARPVQTVSSLGDVIRNVGETGFWVQAGASVVVDSLDADSVNQDGGSVSAGIDVYDARLAITHSRIADVPQGVGVSVWADQLNNRSVLESRHNVIERTGGQGIWGSRYGTIPRTPPAQLGPPIQRGPLGGSNYGPDTVISVGDSIRATGGAGIQADEALYLLVDTAVVDSAQSEGIYASQVARVDMRGARVRRAFGTGLYLYFVDTALVKGTAVDSSGSDGVYFSYGSVLSVDSSRIAGNGGSGISTYCGSCAGSGQVTRSTLSGNGTGLFSDGFAGGISVVARRNVISGNVIGGASNPTYATGGAPLMDADTNYWGDTAGPTCTPAVGNCPGTVGDSVLTTGVSFAGWLTSAPANVMTVPAFVRSVARTTAPAGATSLTAGETPRPVPGTRPAAVGAPQLEPRPPLVGWRRGRPPQPVKVHHSDLR
jgi:hypothetical protein